MPLMSWFASIVRRCTARHERSGSHAPHSAAGSPELAQAPAAPAVSAAPAARSRPLRVWRVVDASAHAGAAGRLVMSGRLADVCAELDRLAALEAMAA